MDFKVDRRKHIKLQFNIVTDIMVSFGTKPVWYEKFQSLTGLCFTKTKKSTGQERMWHFKIVDVQKYFLAKIKYGL